MPTRRSSLLVLGLCLPLALTGCSGSSTGTSTPSPSSSSTTASPGAPNPTFSPGYPVASIYIVTAKPGVTDKDLQDAVARIGKLAGVESVSFTGKHQVRVEMSLVDLVKRGKPVYEELVKLGTVTLG